MTDTSAVRVYLKDVIGLQDEEGPKVGARRVAVQNKGLTTIDDFVDFDDESMKTLCSFIQMTILKESQIQDTQFQQSVRKD